MTVCLQNKSPFRTLAKTSRTINNSQRSLKQGPRNKFSSGGAKEECVKEILGGAGGGGACLWISIQFLSSDGECE